MSEQEQNGSTAPESTDGESGRGNTRPSVGEMEDRTRRAITLFGGDMNHQMTEDEIGAGIGLTGSTQATTLCNRMLRLGQLQVAGKRGKKRLFSLGYGVGEEPQPLESIPFERILTQLDALDLGMTVRVVGKRLDPNDRPIVDLRTAQGRVLTVSAA